MLRLIFALILAANTSTAEQFDLPGGRGGDILVYAYKADELKRQGRSPRFVGGQTYRSAQIMLVSVPGACVQSGAGFEFHGPAWADGRDMTDIEHYAWSKEIARHYPAKLARWFMETGRFATYRVKGSWVISMGARSC